MKNKVQLIAYVDRFSGGDLKDLDEVLKGALKGVFGAIHLLPFFYPIDGEDAGFDPIQHTLVDPRLGDWEDIKKIGEHTSVVADMIVNHMSAASPEFQDVIKNNGQSEYHGLFLTEKRVFPDGPTVDELDKIYRPRPGSPFTEVEMANGEKENFWTTFTANQIDIDIYHPKGKQYLLDILNLYHQVGIKLMRLDAVGYAVKKPGTSCFMIPETYSFIQELTEKAHDLNIEVLVEIHSYYADQIEIAKRVDYVYDFALPPLILHAIFNRTGRYLNDWLAISPRNAITVLDTHDGIGVIDIGPDAKDKSRKGLVPDDDIDALVKEMHKRSKGTSAKATGEAASNLDLYQVNSTYYEVLGQDDDQYLLSRMIQFFAPGIPQVYYLGLTAEQNDMELLKETNVGRNINRHYYTKESLQDALERTVTQRLIKLIQLRNDHDAFNGTFSQSLVDNALKMRWDNGVEFAQLSIDFTELSPVIEITNQGKVVRVSL